MDELAEIKTVVSEAVTNCIVHGYQNTLGMIYITVKFNDAGEVSITIRDKGCGIEDVEKAMQPLFTTCNTGERAGMGFTIMESFMDRLTVKSAPGKGTTVSMRKRIAPRLSGRR